MSIDVTDVAALDQAIRDQRLIFHSFVKELEVIVMQPEGVVLRAPLHQTLVVLYRLIDLLTLGRELLQERPDITSLGDLPREEVLGSVSMLARFVAFYEARLKVNRSMLMGDRM